MNFSSFSLIFFQILHFILTFDIFVDSYSCKLINTTCFDHTDIGSQTHPFYSLAHALQVFDEIVEENQDFQKEYLYFQNYKNNDSVNFILIANSESKLTLSEMASLNAEYNKTQCIFAIFNHSFELPYNITFKGETSSYTNGPKITFEAENVVFYTNFSFSLNFQGLTIQENDNTQISDCKIPTQKYGVFMINTKTETYSKKLWEWSHLLFFNCYIYRFINVDSSINISYSYFISIFEEDNHSSFLSYKYNPNIYFVTCFIENIKLKEGNFFIYSINFFMYNVTFNVGNIIFVCSEKNIFSNIILMNNYFKSSNGILFASAYNCNISLLGVKFEILTSSISYLMSFNSSNVLNINELSLYYMVIRYIFYFQYNNTAKITNSSLISIYNLKSIVYANSSNTLDIINLTALNVIQNDQTIFDLNKFNILDVKYFNYSNPEDVLIFNIFLKSNNSNLIKINQVFLDSQVSKIISLNDYSNELNVSNINFTNCSKKIYSQNLINNVDTNLLFSNNNSININNNSFYGFYLNFSGMFSSCEQDEKSKQLCKSYCVPGLYDDMFNNFCHFCSNNCSQCEKESTLCTQCPADFFLTNEKICLSYCPYLFFKDLLDRKCYAICPDRRYGDIMNFSCVDSCSIGFYPNEDDRLCEFCDFNCKQCFNNQKNCTLCKYDFLDMENETCFDSKSKFFTYF